jgi:hypothetical protein
MRLHFLKTKKEKNLPNCIGTFEEEKCIEKNICNEDKMRECRFYGF